jgi:hypothetical protein
VIALTASGCGSATADLPETPLAATFEAFGLDAEGEETAFDPSRLPVDPHSVEARWYVADGRYVLFLAGPGPDQIRHLCVNAQSNHHWWLFATTEGACAGAHSEALDRGGTSRCGPLVFDLTRGWVFATREGQCYGGLDETMDGSGIRRCGSLVLYVTDIPADGERPLWARVLSFHGTDVIGVFSVVDTSAGPAPEIDLNARRWSVRPGDVRGAPEGVEC